MKTNKERRNDPNVLHGIDKINKASLSYKLKKKHHSILNIKYYR